MKKGYVDIPEGQVHYRTKGSGEPLLLLHQAPLSSVEFDDVIPILAQDYRVVAMDTLGHGNSDNPPREYEVEDFARSVISFLDALGIDQTSIVGHHTGAAIAAEVATTYPKRVDKLILSGIGGSWKPEELQAFLSQPMSRDLPMTEDGYFLIKTWQTYKSLAVLGSNPQLRFKPFIVGLEARTRPYDAHYAVFRSGYKSRLSLIKSPTLLINGSEDLFFDQNQLESYKNLIPHCVTRVIEGSGAMICFEKPEEFAEAILSFLHNETAFREG